MKKVMGFLVIGLLALPCWAGTYVNNGTITAVERTEYGEQLIVLQISGGTGNCANSEVVYTRQGQPTTNASLEVEGLNQILSLALYANSTGASVTITGNGSGCGNATSLKVQ